MKYFKKLVRQYNRANGKANQGTDSMSNEITGDDAVVLSHSKNTTTRIQRPRRSSISTAKKSTASSRDNYNKKGRYDTSRSTNNSDKSYNSSSSQRNPSQNSGRNEISKSTTRDNRDNRSDSRDRFDSRNTMCYELTKTSDKNLVGRTNSSIEYIPRELQ